MAAAKTLSADDFSAFTALVARLSPENLSCDGERSMADQRMEAKIIGTEWKALEEKIGCGHVTADEIEEEYCKRPINQRNRP